MTLIRPVKNKLLVLILLFSCTGYAQQESSIKIDSGNHNKISVVQSGRADSQRSVIDVKKSDSNAVQIDQKSPETAKEKTGWFNDLINNTGALFGLIVSIATIAGLIWKGVAYVKKKKKRKK